MPARGRTPVLKSLPVPLLALLAAVASSSLGGTAIVATRYVVPEAGVLPTVALRFGGAALLMLALTLPRAPLAIEGRDRPWVVALGLVQFALFPYCFTRSLEYIPAARAALVLATQPLITLALACLAGRERFTLAKAVAGLVALASVGFALGERVDAAGDVAWKGDLFMFGASLSGSLYNVSAGRVLGRYRALVVGTVMVSMGAVAAWALMGLSGELRALAHISARGWMAVAYLASFGGFFTFFLWIWALEHAPPSRVALAVSFNPIVATLLGQLVLGEPAGGRLLLGLGGVILSLLIVNARHLRWPGQSR